MNRKAYYAGQRAASECYLLSGHLLDMHAEQETAEQARDRCQFDHETWYWNGVIDWIREFQAARQERRRPLIPVVGIQKDDGILKAMPEGETSGASFSRYDAIYTTTENKPKRRFFVYRITNSINARLYIGCTTRTLLERWAAHKTNICSKRDGWKPLYRDMQTYGVGNFSIEPITECGSNFEMRKQEALHIYNENTLWPNGYNLNLSIRRVHAVTDNDTLITQGL